MKKTPMWLGALAAAGLVFAGTARGEHEGPHKGILVEWGEEEYHLEIVPDVKAGSVIVYVYGGEEDLKKGTAKAIDSKSLVMTVKGAKPVTVKLEPQPAKGDPAGLASVFVAKHDVFKADANLTGTVSGKVGTKPYSGEFKQK